MNALRDPSERTGIVLTQVGGPDDLDAVRPYLRSFFSDPDLIRLPVWLKPLQPAFAWSLATLRAPYSRKLYASIGGGSPILPQTQAQATALSAELTRRGHSMPVLIAMRHSRPTSLDAMRAAQEAGLIRLIVLGLFPQYSFSTTLSGMSGLKNAMDGLGYHPEVLAVDEYCDDPGFVEAVADVTSRALRSFAMPPERIHLIFSAHGLPLSYIKGGDPYAEHVKRSVTAVQNKLKHPGPVHTSFQSKLGPQAWLEPASDVLLRDLGREGVKAVCMVPIAFVSEHVETLNEIDIQYRDIAQRSGIVEFHRACTVKCHPAFIRCLADQAQKALTLTPLVPAGT